mgnify:CR=1 FL=1
MITKREKLQYVYVFLTDIAALAASVILAWLIVGGIMGQLLPYSVLDWVQALVLLVLAYTVTLSSVPAGRKPNFPSSPTC